MFTTIRKRDGREVSFDDSKITDAIFKAARAVGGEDRELAVSLTLDVLRVLKQEYNGQIFGVEDVQDVVEKVLIERGHARTAKAYILYRDKRTRIRDAQTELMDIVEDIIKETDRDNANVGNSPSAKMLQIASAASRNYYLTRLLDEDYSLAHQRGDIHIHDLDFYATTLNCVPDFEYTMVRDPNGETRRVRFDYFDRFFEKYRERIRIIDGVEVLPLDGYQVYGRSGWTKIHKAMRRFMRDEEHLYGITTRKGLPLHLTGNHRLPVIRNNDEVVICAQEIKKDDKLLSSKHEFGEAFEMPADVVQVDIINDYRNRVYDLETEEHWFMVNDYVVHNCLQIPLDELLRDGFDNGHGFIRPPKRPASATALAAIILQSSQNDMYGGQSFPFFDTQMAPFIDGNSEEDVYQAMEALVYNLNSMHCLPHSERIWVYDVQRRQMEQAPIGVLADNFEYDRYQAISLNPKTGAAEFKFITGIKRKGNHRRLITLIDDNGNKVTSTDNHMIMYKDKCGQITEAVPEKIPNLLSPADPLHPLNNKISSVAVKRTIESNSGNEYVYDISVADNETFLTAGGVFIHNSRAGSQVPFSSLNLGTDTSEAGRKITRNLLLAYEAGLGKGENPIFPNVIFRLKKGINFDPEDPNYDLFQLAVRVASKRLNPTFSFMDSSFNKEYGDQVAYMGCRTRVMANRRGPAATARRGNLSFTTINLPRLAIKAERNLKRFYSLLDELTELTVNQLYHRFNVQCRLRVKDIPFVMGQGLYMGSEDLRPEDSIEPAIVNGTLSVGVIGLAETLTALTGYHHGQSEDSQVLGLEIMQHINEQVEDACERFDLNYTFLATPAEGLCGRFVALDRKEFKLIPGVTDRDYYTNSFHIPVYHPTGMHDKIRLEGQYHKYFNAGHISYVELSSPPQHNPQAVEALIRHMADCDMGYAGINYPVDFCLNCSMLGVFNDPECPRCGSTNIRRVRRITGYLSTVDRFNDGKVAELRDRLPHS